ncbi:hypothetical protein P9112_003278 [Eukaryota sp. TZLM1-RC]
MNRLLLLLSLLCYVCANVTYYSTDGSCSSWTEPDCWTDGLPGPSDSAVLASCSHSLSVVVSSSISLSSLHIGSEDCKVILTLAPGASISTSSLIFTHGTLQGSGHVLCSGSSFVSGPYNKTLALQLGNQGNLAFEGNSSVTLSLTGGAVLLNSGTLSINAPSLITYHPDHDPNGNQHPQINNLGNFVVNDDVEVDVRFSNQQLVNVLHGIAVINNPNELMGNYDLFDTLLITKSCEFRRGSDIYGATSGVLVVPRSVTYIVAGSYRFDGNLQLLSNSKVYFAARSSVRVFSSNHAESGSLVEFQSSCALRIASFFRVNVNSGVFSVNTGASWQPTTNAIRSITLNGNSRFVFNPSVGNVTLTDVSVYDNGIFEVSSGGPVYLRHLLIGDEYCANEPRVLGSDQIRVEKTFDWFNGLVDTDILVQRPGVFNVFPVFGNGTTIFGQENNLIVDGNAFLNGSLNMESDTSIVFNNQVYMYSQIPLYLGSSSTVELTDNSWLFVIPNNDSTLITGDEFADFSFNGNLTINSSAFILNANVSSFYAANTNYTLEANTEFLIQSSNSPLINGTFSLAESSFVSTGSNEVTFVKGSVVHGKGLLNPGSNGAISFYGNYSASPFISKPFGSLKFFDAFIRNITEISGSSGELTFFNIDFPFTKWILSEINLNRVTSLFESLPPIQVDHVVINRGSFNGYAIGNSESLLINSLEFSGGVTFHNLTGLVSISNLVGTRSRLFVNSHLNNINLGSVELANSGLLINNLPNALTITNCILITSVQVDLSNINFATIDQVLMNEDSKFKTSSLNSLVVNTLESVTSDFISNDIETLSFGSLNQNSNSTAFIANSKSVSVDSYLANNATLNIQVITHFLNFNQFNQTDVSQTSISECFMVFFDNFFQSDHSQFFLNGVLEAYLSRVSNFALSEFKLINNHNFTADAFINSFGIVYFNSISDFIKIFALLNLADSELFISNTESLVISSFINQQFSSFSDLNSISFNEFVQNSTDSAQLEVVDVNTINVSHFVLSAGTVVFNSVDDSVYNNLELKSNNPVSFTQTRSKSIKILDNLYISDQGTLSFANVEFEFDVPGIDLFGNLNLNNFQFAPTIPHLALFNSAILSLNTGDNVIIKDYFNVYHSSIRKGSDHLTISKDSIFSGGTFEESGTTEYLSSLSIETNSTKAITSKAKLIFNKVVDISSEVDELLFGESQLLFRDVVNVPSAIHFKQVEFPRSEFEFEDCSINLLQNTTIDPFISGNAVFSIADSLILTGGSDLKSTTLDIGNVVIFDSFCLPFCDQLVDYYFDSNSIIRQSPSYLITKFNVSVVYSGSYLLDSFYIHRDGSLNFKDSDAIELTSILVENGNFVYESSTSTTGFTNLTKFSSVGGSSLFESINSLYLYDVNLMGGDLLIKSSSTGNNLYLPLISIKNDSVMVIEDSETQVSFIDLESGTFSFTNYPTLLKEQLFINQGSISSGDSHLTLSHSSVTFLFGNGDKHLLPNSNIALYGSLVLDSSGVFHGHYNAKFEVLGSANISIIQPSVWHSADGVATFLLSSADSVLSVMNDFDISWFIESKAQINVIDDSKFRIAGGGSFDSDIVLCANCTLELADGHFIFPSHSKLRGLNNTLDATYFITDGSSVLFEGLFLLDPNIILGSGYLHFMEGSVYNISSLIVPKGGFIEFSECPNTGIFNVSLLDITGGRAVLNSLSCEFVTFLFYLENGLFNSSLITGDVLISDFHSINSTVTFGEVNSDFVVENAMSISHSAFKSDTVGNDWLVNSTEIIASNFNISSIRNSFNTANLNVFNSTFIVVSIQESLIIQNASFTASFGQIDYIGSDLSIESLISINSVLNFIEIGNNFLISSPLDLVDSKLLVNSVGSKVYIPSLTGLNSEIKFINIGGDFNLDEPLFLSNSSFNLYFITGNFTVPGFIGQDSSLSISSVHGVFRDPIIFDECVVIISHITSSFISNNLFFMYDSTVSLTTINEHFETNILEMSHAKLNINYIKYSLTTLAFNVSKGNINVRSIQESLIIQNASFTASFGQIDYIGSDLSIESLISINSVLNFIEIGNNFLISSPLDLVDSKLLVNSVGSKVYIPSLTGLNSEIKFINIGGDFNLDEPLSLSNCQFDLVRIHGDLVIPGLVFDYSAVDLVSILGTFNDPIQFISSKVLISNITTNFEPHHPFLIQESVVDLPRVQGHFHTSSLDSLNSTVHFGLIQGPLLFYSGYISNESMFSINSIEGSVMVSSELQVSNSIAFFGIIDGKLATSNLNVTEGKLNVVSIQESLIIQNASFTDSFGQIDYIGSDLSIESLISINSVLNFFEIGNNFLISSPLDLVDSKLLVNSVGSKVYIPSLTRLNSEIKFINIGGNFTLDEPLYITNGKFELTFVGGNVFVPGLVVEDAELSFNFIEGEVNIPFINLLSGIVEFDTIEQDITIDSLRVAGGDVIFKDLSGNLIINGMDLNGGSLIFDELITPLALKFLNINGTFVSFNTNHDVTIDVVRIHGYSTVSGEDLVFITEYFEWFGGSIDSALIETGPEAQVFIGSEHFKFIDDSTISVKYTIDFIDNPTILLGSDSLIDFGSSLLINFQTFTSLYSINEDSKGNVLILGGDVEFASASIIFDLFVEFHGVGKANETLFSFSFGSFFTGTLELIGECEFNILDKGVYEFDENSKLIGPFTYLNVGYTESSITTSPTVIFNGSFSLNPSVLIEFGSVYFESLCSFEIHNLTVFHPGKAEFNGVSGPLWTLNHLEVSGILHIFDLHRPLNVYFYQVYGSKSFVHWKSIKKPVMFKNSVFVSDGKLKYENFPNIYHSLLQINSAELITEVTKSLKVTKLESSNSDIIFNSNPNPIKVEVLLLSSSQLTSSTDNDLFITRATIDTSSLRGSDHAFIDDLVFNSGHFYTDVTSVTALLTSEGTKNFRQGVLFTITTHGVYDGGQFTGFSNAEIVIEKSSVFELNGPKLFYTGSTSPRNFHNSAKLSIFGSVSRSAGGSFDCSFELFIEQDGQLDFLDGLIYLLAGGYNKGHFHLHNSASIRLGPSRTKFGYEFGHKSFELLPGSVTEFNGSLSMDRFSILNTYSSFSLSSFDCDSGSFYFGPETILDVYTDAIHCTSHCVVVFDSPAVPVELDSITVQGGGSITLNNFKQFTFIHFNSLLIEDSVVVFNSGQNVIIGALDLVSGILEGLDTVQVDSNWNWKSGRIGSPRSFTSTTTFVLNSDCESLIETQRPKHLAYDSVLENSGELTLVHYFPFFIYRSSSIVNSGIFFYGKMCGASICDNLASFDFSAVDIDISVEYPDVSFRPTILNIGDFVKLDGTFTLTNNLPFNQTGTGTFTLNGRFNQRNSDSNLDGLFTIYPSALFDIGSSTGTVKQSSVWNGLEGRLRTSSGGTINFNGYYNLTLDFQHSIGTFTFKKHSDYELDSIAISGGRVNLPYGKERSDIFDLRKIHSTGGTLNIDNVNQLVDIDEFTQTNGVVNIDTVNNFLNFGTMALSQDSGRTNIINVLRNVTFANKVTNTNGTLIMKNLQEWLVFQSGIYIGSSHRFDLTTVENNVFTPKSFDLRGAVNFIDLKQKLIIDDYFNVSTSSARVKFSEILNDVIIRKGLFVFNGQTEFSSISGNTFLPFIHAYSGSLKLLTIKNLYLSTEILSETSLTVDNYVFIESPRLITRPGSAAVFKNGISHIDVDFVQGTGGYCNVITLPTFETTEFKPHGGNFLFQSLSSTFILPNFEIRSGSLVELRSFVSFSPKLPIVKILDGSLRLASGKSVTIDHLVLDGSNAKRDGSDIANVNNEIFFKQGCFCGGVTKSLQPLRLTTSGRKDIFAELHANVLCEIEVNNGQIRGNSNGKLYLEDETNITGDFWFSSTTSSNYPVIYVEDTMTFSTAQNRRRIDWFIDIAVNTIHYLNDFELLFGDGGGVIRATFYLQPNTKLAFGSNQAINSRTHHLFTATSIVNCDTCTFDFRTNSAWVKYNGQFNLFTEHVQNYGRFELFSTARHPIKKFVLSNCDVHLLHEIFDGADTDYNVELFELNQCGRLNIVNSRYNLNIENLAINGGSVEISNHDHHLLLNSAVLNGGAFMLNNFIHPVSFPDVTVNSGFIWLNTCHDVHFDHFVMRNPVDPSRVTCFSSINFQPIYNDNSYNNSLLAGYDSVTLDFTQWLGGSIEVEVDFMIDLHSVDAGDRGFSKGKYVNIHDTANLGGPGDFYLTGPSTWTILDVAHLEFWSQVFFHCMLCDSLPTFINYGHLNFPIPDISVTLDFIIHNYNLFTSEENTEITFNGPSTSYGSSKYLMEDGSGLHLRHYSHTFKDGMIGVGDGNIHMDNWNFNTHTRKWSPENKVLFDGTWDLSPIFIQPTGNWVFGKNAFINLTEIHLTERAHVLVDGSRSASGNWTFDRLNINTHSWFIIDGTDEEITSRSLVMSSDEFIRFRKSSEALEFTDIELYNGEAEFSTSHHLNFQSLIVDGGTKSGSDHITTNEFAWNCGIIEGSGTIFIKSKGTIGTCSSTQWLSSPPVKQLRGTSKLVFLPGSELFINTEDAVNLYDSTTIVIEGYTEMINAYFLERSQNNVISFMGPLTEAITGAYRVFDAPVEILYGEFHLKSGTINPRRTLNVYSDFYSYGDSALLFGHVDHNSTHYFHSTSQYIEVKENDFQSARFEPTTSSTEVIVEGTFNTSLLHFSIGTITFTGPIDLDIAEIRLVNLAVLQFISLDNDLGSVRGFDLRGNSLMLFNTGQGIITFDGFGLLDENAEIFGVNDDIQIIGNSSSFEWNGGSFAGDITVDLFTSLTIAGQNPKAIRLGAVVIAHEELEWNSNGNLFGYDGSKLVVSEEGSLKFVSNGQFDCRGSFTNSDKVCDAFIEIFGTASIDPFSMRVVSYWGIFVEGKFTLNMGLFEAFSFIRGDGSLIINYGTTFSFTSASEDSLLGPNSNILSTGTINLFEWTTVYIQGTFETDQLVSVGEGTLVFHDSAVLVNQFDLTVVVGNAIFNKVTQMVPLNTVHCEYGNVTFNTESVVTIDDLLIDHGFLHGSDQVEVLNQLLWQGSGGLGKDSNVFNLAYGEATVPDTTRVMEKNATLTNKGYFLFSGYQELLGYGANIINTEEGHMLFTDLIKWERASFTNESLMDSYFINYGSIDVTVTQFDCQFVFLHYGVLNLILGEFYFAGGGSSFGPVYAMFGTTVGVDDRPFTFESGNNSYIEGNNFFFGLRNPTGIFYLKTRFSLKQCTIQDNGRFYITDDAFIAEEVSVVVRGTQVVFEDFINPDVSFTSLELGFNSIVSMVTGHHITIDELLINGGFRGGTDTVTVKNQFEFRAGGGFQDESITYAEQGSIFIDIFEKEFKDLSTVIFNGPVIWLQESDIRGGLNTTIVFNDVLEIHDTGNFVLYDWDEYEPMTSPNPVTIPSQHSTPDSLPVVFVNHGMDLTSDWEDIEFKFEWELQNYGNITIPETFVMKVLSGGFDSHPSRLLSSPGSTLEVGAPYPYIYNEDTWFYANRSTLKMTPGSLMSFNGFVCFDYADIGPAGTIIVRENATMCRHTNLIIEGTELIIEGDAYICDLIMKADYTGSSGSRLFITCSLTWYRGVFGGGSFIFIEPQATFLLELDPEIEEPKEDEIYHVLGEGTSFVNYGSGLIKFDLYGDVGTQFINEGDLKLERGNWSNLNNQSLSWANLINRNDLLIQSSGVVNFDWNVTQEHGHFKLEKGHFNASGFGFVSGLFELSSDTIFTINSGFTFINSNVKFYSPNLVVNDAFITFINSSVNWEGIDYDFNFEDSVLTFDKDTIIGRSPGLFTLIDGLIEILDVSNEFTLNKFKQTDGLLYVSSLVSDPIIANYQFQGGVVNSASVWSVSDFDFESGEFVGVDVFNPQKFTIKTDGEKICNTHLNISSGVFESGTVLGTDNCVISSPNFIVETLSVVKLEGCSAVFNNQQLLHVKSGTFKFNFGELNGGNVLVDSHLLLTKCPTVFNSNLNVSNDGKVSFNSDVVLSEDSKIQGSGTIEINSNVVINGNVDFYGCFIISGSGHLNIDSATVQNIEICDLDGSLFVFNSSIHIILINNMGGNTSFSNTVVNNHFSINKLIGKIHFKGSDVNTLHIHQVTGRAYIADQSIIGNMEVAAVELGFLQFEDCLVDSYTILNFNSGKINFLQDSSVNVTKHVQFGGSTVVNGEEVSFAQANVTVLDGSFNFTNGFIPDLTDFLVEGDVVIDQFASNQQEVNVLTLNDGKFVITPLTQFNIAKVNLHKGTFGGPNSTVEELYWTHGNLDSDSVTHASNVKMTSELQKEFKSGSKLVVYDKGEWNDGTVMGEDGSVLEILTDSSMIFTGTEGWYTQNIATDNSAIFSTGILEFSTLDSITMEWDIFSTLITVSKGNISFEESDLSTDNFIIEQDATIHLRNRVNVTDFIGGAGDVVIDDEDSYVLFEGTLNQTGTLYMRDGLLDLRQTEIVNVTIVYTGGIILFREDVNGDRVNIPELGTDLDIVDTDLLELIIGKCNGPVTIKNSKVSKVYINEMYENCHVVFKEGAIVEKVVINDMFDGSLVFNDESDVKFDYIKIHNGLVVAQPGSSPSFTDSTLIINDGNVTLNEASKTKFKDVTTELNGGELVIHPSGTKNCPQWPRLILNHDANLVINEPDCVSKVNLLEVNDMAKITSFGTIHVKDMLFNGGVIGKDSTSFHVLNEITVTDCKDKLFGQNVRLFINNTGRFESTSETCDSFNTKFDNNAVLYIDHSAFLNFSSSSSKSLNFVFACDDCNSFTGIRNFGELYVEEDSVVEFSVYVESVGDFSLHSNSEVDFNQFTEILGNLLLDSLAQLNVNNDLLQHSTSNVEINTDAMIYANSDNIFFNGQVDCEAETTDCLTVESGSVNFTESFTSTRVNLKISNGELNHYGKLDVLNCNIVKGNLSFKSGAVIDSINHCKVKSSGSVIHHGISETKSVGKLEIVGGKYHLLDASIINSHESTFILVGESSEFISKSGALFNLTNAIINLKSGHYLFESSSVTDSPTIAECTITGGNFDANLDELVLIDDLHLDGSTAKRSGESTIEVLNLFTFTNGTLSGSGITKSLKLFKFNSQSQQSITDGHLLELIDSAEFSRCNVYGEDQASIHVLSNSTVNITGTCSFTAGDSSDLVIWNEGTINSNHDSVEFGWYFTNDFILNVESGQLILSGNGTSSNLINIMGRLIIKSTVISTDSATINGSEQSLIVLNSAVSYFINSGTFDVKGDLKLEHTGVVAEFVNQSSVLVVNFVVDHGFLRFTDNSIITSFSGTLNDGVVSILSNSRIDFISIISQDGGLLSVNSAKLIDFSQSNLILSGGEFIADNNATFDHTNATIIGGHLLLTSTLSGAYAVHFDNMELLGGIFETEGEANPVFIDSLLLNGGTRQGDRTLVINTVFIWESGYLKSKAITESIEFTLFRTPEEKDLGSNHELLLSRYSVFEDGNLKCYNNTRVINNFDSNFIITGKGSITDVSDDITPLFINKNTATVIKQGCGEFTVSISLHNYGLIKIHDISSCSSPNSLIVSGDSWSIGVIKVTKQSILDIKAQLHLNHTSLLEGSGDVSLTSSSSFLIVSNTFNHTGFVNVTADEAQMDITRESNVFEINLLLLADGIVNIKEGSNVTLITSKVNKGKLNVHGAGIEQYESLTCNGGVVNLFENSVVEFSQSKLEINGGEVVFHPLSQISITNSILHLTGGDLIIFDSSVQTQPLFETVIIDGGELFFNSSNDLYIENLYMNDGKRSGFGVIEVSNVLTWKGGKLYESGITKNMKLMVVEGDSLMEIDEGHTLVNYGNVTLLEGTLEAGAFTRIVNKPNAVFEIGGQGKLNPTSENEALPLFINYGIFAKISTADTFEFLLGLQNHEFVLIENGSLSIGTDSFSTDTIQINEGCTLELTGKFDLLNTSIVVNSPGNIHVSRPESNVFVDGLFDHSGQFFN